MREHLFRGKWKDEPWRYGDLEHKKDFHSSRKYVMIHEQYDSVSHEVYADTVGEYTGLTDKNGKKIFEGDIVKMHYFYDDFNPQTLKAEKKEAENTGTIEIIDSTLYVRDIKDEESIYAVIDYCEDPGEELEVIGNVTDNPELLKGAEG